MKIKNPARYEAYLKNQNNLEIGDVILTRGTSFLARTIRLFDGGYINHSGFLVNVEGRWMVVEALQEGATMSFLSKRIAVNQDFEIYRIQGVSKDEKIAAAKAVLSTINDLDGSTSYDYGLLLKVALIRTVGRLKLARHWFLTDNRGESDLCSETTRRLFDELGLYEYSEEFMIEKTGRPIITPQDYCRWNTGILKRIL